MGFQCHLRFAVTIQIKTIHFPPCFLFLIPNPHKTMSHRKLRNACDTCHRSKVRCSGTSPCSRCAGHGIECTYSPSNRPGIRAPRARNVDKAQMFSSPSSEANQCMSAISIRFSLFAFSHYWPSLPLIYIYLACFSRD